MRIAEVIQNDLKFYRQQTQDAPSQQTCDHIRILEVLGRMAEEVDHLSEVVPLLADRLTELKQREEK